MPIAILRLVAPYVPCPSQNSAQVDTIDPCRHLCQTSIQVDAIRSSRTNEALIRISFGSRAVCVGIPEAARANANSLATLLTYGHLDNDLVAVEVELLQAILDFICYLPCQQLRCLHVVCHLV